ncbi:AmmeMemoRadiSam system protein B [Chloroflexota bacterium]
MVRKPVVADAFYAGSKDRLRQQIEYCFKHSLGPGSLPDVNKAGERHILGLVSPHAGYMASGPVAAHGFYKLASESKPDVVVILGLVHRGMGAEVSLSRQDKWQTPLGELDLDAEVGERIVAEAGSAEWDELAHSYEHSIEVQLPFLQYIYQGGFRIVPIAMLRQSLGVSLDLGEAVANAVKDRRAIIIASSDFSHYESQELASRKDKSALEAILRLDEKRLQEVVNEHDISMCGPGPVMCMLAACKRLGAGQAQLLSYATSGDIIGDRSQVVGYASVAVTI